MNRSEFDYRLRHGQESLEFALESGRMGIWDINLETKVVTCSKTMLTIWGVSEDEFTGQRSVLQKKVHPDDLEEMKLAIDRAIKNNSVYEHTYRIIPSPGVVRWVLSRGRCTFDTSKLPLRFSGVVYDITEKKEREAELAEAINSRNQFFMNASHELRTPLTSLALQIQVAEWELNNLYPEAFSKERIQAGLAKQKAQLMRITRIVDNILDESRISRNELLLQLEVFEMCDMVRDVLTRFRVLAETSKVEIRFQPSQGHTGEWDRFRLEQVLLNLLNNAIRYGKNNPVHIDVVSDEKTVKLKVKDQGIGIHLEDQEKIFQRFQRLSADKDVSGMGLGLYISKNIVLAHGGDIQVESVPHIGSTFTVVLPRQKITQNEV